MILSIEKRDLFTVSKDYTLCHCISADFALGAGIAKKFKAELCENCMRYLINIIDKFHKTK